MVISLNKKWKELVFAFSGFGPNLMMVLMSAYFTDAINPAALPSDSFQAILGGTCFILPAVFPILYALSKAFDGIIDIPFAHITDTLSTKWGRRRPAIAVCAIPMIISFVLCWIPIGGAENQLLNTIWIVFWSLVFFATYTMCLIAFYGSLSSVCSDESQRLRVSSYKSFFDTVSYCAVYALVPLMLDAFKLNIDKFVFICTPLMLTIIIPLVLIKEGEKYGYPENFGLKAEKVKILDSIKLTFSNKLFRAWLYVYACITVGLQMFLVGMNAMIVGGMSFSGAEMALVNTCAFAPVPIMLYLFNKLKAKKGIRFTFQTCLLAFGIAILSFFFASTFITGGNKPLQYAIACSGAILGSWAIGSFFMMPYLVPAQISGVEERLTGKNHSAMYFAGSAVVSSLVGAISSSVIYENIKMLFIDKNTYKIVWAENLQVAADKMSADASSVYNFGTLVIPFVVCIVCVLGYFLAFKMPKELSPENVAKELKKQNPSLDISSVTTENVSTNEKGEMTFIQACLFVLSGSLFGFIWLAFVMRSIKELCSKKRILPTYLLASLIPFVGGFIMAKQNKALAEIAKARGLTIKPRSALHIIFGIILPILPLNIVSLVITQNNVNRVYADMAKQSKHE